MRFERVLNFDKCRERNSPWKDNLKDYKETLALYLHTEESGWGWGSTILQQEVDSQTRGNQLRFNS